MYQARDVSLMPEKPEDEIGYSNSIQSHVLLRESEIVNSIEAMSDRMADLQQKIARLYRNQNNGAVRTSSALPGISQQLTLGGINLANSQNNQSPVEQTDEENPWLLPQNRRSTVLESTLINTSYNDQPLNQLPSMVSPKREPISAPTVTATNAQLHLQTNEGALQLHGSHSGLGVINQPNLSDYLVENRSTKAGLQVHNNRQHHNIGKRLTREPLCALPTFDGSSNLKMFRHNFQEFCDMNGYVTEREVTFWLKQCFKGRAKDILYDECSDISVIWSRLENRFGDHLMRQKYSVSLPNRKRQQNESLIDLADDIRRMSNVVYFDLQYEQKERMAVMHFLNALHSPMAQYDISQKAPKSLEEALNIASVREMFFGVESHQSKPDTSNQNIRSNNISSGGNNHMPYPTVNQWPAHINAISSLPQPAHNMSPQLYCNAPRQMPSVTQPGQLYVPAQGSGNAQGTKTQQVFYSNAPDRSCMYNLASVNHGSNNQAYQGENLSQQNRGMGNSQPISR